jgi:hypothetical protein
MFVVGGRIVSLSMSMIALGPNPHLSVAAIQADLAQQWPSLPEAEAAEQKEGTFAFRVGSQDVVAGIMPAPIPWADLEGPCRTSWLWKDAAEVLRSHATHLILTVNSEETPLERMRLLTQVTASILATCPEALGVFWTHASMVIQPPLFRDFATQMIERPLYIWVDFRVGQNAAGKSSGFTTGMEALGHMEIETDDSPEPPGELRERLFGLANYVLDNGPVIRDGDTIGEDANERIRVVHADSAFGHKGKVMRLEYSAKPKKPWWRPW